MRPQKIILYYGFTRLDDPDAMRLWQRTLCEKLSLNGRILISRHGINGTLGGDLDDLRRYIAATKEFPGFRTIDFKWSEGSGDDFPRLRVRVRDEIVSFGASEELVRGPRRCRRWRRSLGPARDARIGRATGRRRRLL